MASMKAEKVVAQLPDFEIPFGMYPYAFGYIEQSFRQRYAEIGRLRGLPLADCRARIDRIIEGMHSDVAGLCKALAEKVEQEAVSGRKIVRD